MYELEVEVKSTAGITAIYFAACICEHFNSHIPANSKTVKIEIKTETGDGDVSTKLKYNFTSALLTLTVWYTRLVFDCCWGGECQDDTLYLYYWMSSPIIGQFGTTDNCPGAKLS